MGYELLDDGLTKSTLWLFGSKDAKILFVTILSECHGSDIVRVPVPVLVKLAGLTREEGDAALTELQAADPDSRCPAEDGRRIVPVEDEQGKGLFLPSYKSRRNRFLTANRKKSFNARKEAGNGKERSGTIGNGEFDLETETETETETENSPPTPPQAGGPRKRDLEKFNRSMQGLSREAYAERFRQRFGMEPKP